MKTQNKYNINILKFTFFVAILAIAFGVCLLPSVNSGVAYADAPSVVFPSSGYFQSENPTLIAANDAYLLVYDETQNRLYVRSNTSRGNYDYVLSFSHVLNLFAVGDKAFFVADDKYYAIDLTDTAATAQEVTLATPDDIAYLTTDGTYLYAKSDFGFITIYNDDFDVAFGQNNAKNAALAGQFVIVGNESTVYIFSTNYGFPKFKILNLATTDPAQEYSIASDVQAASFGAVIFASIGGRIACLDKNTGESILTSEIEPDAFASCGRNLFTIEGNSVNIYTLSQDNTALERTNSLTMKASDGAHFDVPVDIEKLPTKFAVADSKNNRIAYFDESSETLTTFDLENSPTHLAHDGNILYIAVENQILKLNSVYVEQRYSIENIKDLLYLDKLYVLTDEGVYVLFGGEFEEFYETTAGVALAAAENGKNVFLATETEIVVLDSDGNKLPTSLVGDFANVKDIAVDYVGNVIIAYENKVEVFTNNISSLEFSSTNQLGGELRATLTSCKLVGNELYFTASESYVGKIALDVKTKDNHVVPAIPSDVYTLDYSYVKATNANTYFMPTSFRQGDISLATDETLMVFECSAAPQNYYIGYDGLSLLYLPKAGFEVVQTDALSGEYVATKQTILFVTPNRDSENNVVLEEGEHVVFKRTTAGFDGGKWIVVEYENAEYFATASDYSEYIPPAPERRAKYGRAKGNRVGGIVNVYQSASTDSVVILEIADGAKVEILETLDDFYKVSVNGTVGYMRKDDVQLGGLTTVQIVSIILAILVLLAGSTVFTAIYFTKKKQATTD